MHPFRAFIHQYSSLTDIEWKKIEACLTYKAFPTNRHILKEGKICQHLYFLESGLLRYYTTIDGDEKTKFFTQPPYCFTSQRSFSQSVPSTESIQAIDESFVYQISREDAYRLINEVPNWNAFIRELILEVQYYTQEILEDLQNKTAEDRYKEMLNEGSPLLQNVPLKYLASYLGIAPQSLSRIRKNIVIQQKIKSRRHYLT